MRKPIHILYLAHDLSHPNIPKRVAFLRDGGATVRVAGFRRARGPVELVASVSAINLGQTFDAGFIHRIFSVFRVILTIGKYKQLLSDTDVIMARNMEMLAIAVRIRKMLGNTLPIVYESLDIHRHMLRTDLFGAIMRGSEGWLSRRCVALISSSPAFISEYFEKRSKVRLPARLVENKLYPPPAPHECKHRVPGPPWKIGWFGVIRCRKSLDILTELVKRSSGSVEVIIRGLPSLDQFDDFYKSTSSVPSLSSRGPYSNPEDLETIYSEAHFTWAIDMFEEGLNSSWLLPNRIYEGGFFASVPIVLRSVETGRTVERMGIGITFDIISADTLLAFFQQLTVEQYKHMEQKLLELPISTWAYDIEDARKLVEFLGSFS